MVSIPQVDSINKSRISCLVIDRQTIPQSAEADRTASMAVVSIDDAIAIGVALWVCVPKA